MANGVSRIGTLQVIFKIAEKCNLNCPYCYYYSGADRATDNRPPLIKKDVANRIAQFLRRAADDIQIDHIQIIFHGGEPTLVKAELFDYICSLMTERLSSKVPLSFGVQTNGVFLPEAWIRMLIKHNVSTGVSLDGPEEYNDKFRPDHNGEGSYKRIAANVHRLNSAVADSGLRPIGLVSVVNHEFDYSYVYKHFSEDLGISKMNFLLPDKNCDADANFLDVVEKYGDKLCELFDIWLVSGQGKVEIRQFESLLKFFNVNVKYFSAPEGYINNQIVVIHSDGGVGVDDSLMPATQWFQQRETVDVDAVSLKDWLSRPDLKEVREARSTLPEDCQECRWKNLCHGGDVENRFSSKNGFSNKSIYCAALLKFYSHVEGVLLEGGYPPKAFDDVLKRVPEKVSV